MAKLLHGELCGNNAIKVKGNNSFLAILKNNVLTKMEDLLGCSSVLR